MKKAITMDSIGPLISQQLDVSDCEMLITSRLDLDDFIHSDYVQLIQDYANTYWKGNSFWVNADTGLQYHQNGQKLFKLKAFKNPFISFVEPATNIKTVYFSTHGDSKAYPVHNLPTSKPLWVQVIHDTNLLNKVKSTASRIPFEEGQEIFPRLFK
jgi:hypothetical protein